MDDSKDDDLMLSQICELVEENFEEFLFHLPMDDDILLSQSCDQVETMIDDELLTNYVDHMAEVMDTATDLGISQDELSDALNEPIDCTDMFNDGGCTTLTAWSFPVSNCGK